MKRKVRIRVAGVQSQTGAEGEIITETEGELLFREPYYYVSYREKLDREGDAFTKTTLRFCENELRVSRKGEAESVMEFVRDGIHNSIYRTPYGNFDLMIVTEYLDICIDARGARLEADYGISINKTEPAKGRLRITIDFI